MPLLPSEHESFSLGAPTVVASRTDGLDHSVAGNEEGYFVLSVGGACGPGAAWLSEGAGDIPVGTNLTPGDFEKGLPDTELEFGAAEEYADRFVGAGGCG